MKSVLITNVITKAIFTICITALAISFNNTSIMRWFLLLPFLGNSYKETSTDHPTEKGGEEE